MPMISPAPLTARRSGPLRGEAVVPGDKSISHRALIFGALAVVFAAGMFFYANHATVASFTRSAKPVQSENALREAPAVSGMSGRSELTW